MQINLPSQSCIRDSQEADTPTQGRSHGLTGGGGDLMFNAAGELRCSASHLLRLNRRNAKREQQVEGGSQTGERERMNVNGRMKVCVCK